MHAMENLYPASGSALKRNRKCNLGVLLCKQEGILYVHAKGKMSLCVCVWLFWLFVCLFVFADFILMV